MYYEKSLHQCRHSDLDTQLHVTSRTYEIFCDDARFAILAKHGYPFKKLAMDGIKIQPLTSQVNFFRQQMVDARLEVHTLFEEVSGGIHWYQLVVDQDQQIAAEIIAKTAALNAKGKKVRLLDPVVLSQKVPDFIHEYYLKNDSRKKIIIPAFQNTCRQIKTPTTPLYSLRNFNWLYPSHELWRICEEGRWNFFQKSGISHEMIMRTDTTAFFMGAQFVYNKPLIAGKKYVLKTWLHKIDKLRIYFRQSLVDAKDPDDIYISSMENIILVSVSRSRPKKPPPEWLKFFKNYIEIK